MVDIADLVLPDTAEVHIEHPQLGKLYSDEDKTDPVVIEVYSPSSNQAVAYRRKVTKEAYAAVAKKGTKAALKKTPEEIEDADIERLVAMTAMVRNLDYKGQPVNLDNIHKVYRDEKMNWLTEQVRERIGGWSDFLG